MSKVFLFDLDGTLLDREKSFEPYIRERYKSFGVLQKPYEEYRKRFVYLDKNGYGDKQELYKTLIEEFGIPISVDELINDFRENAWGNSCLFPKAEEVLEELRRQGHKLGIITNGSGRSQRKKVAATGLDVLVDEVVISGDEKIEKPNAEIFNRAMERMGILSEDCIFIGDNPIADIDGARKVGMKTIWVERYFSWPSGLDEKPDYIISGLDEILRLNF